MSSDFFFFFFFFARWGFVKALVRIAWHQPLEAEGVFLRPSECDMLCDPQCEFSDCECWNELPVPWVPMPGRTGR
jgi:hypothetical protein